MHLQTFYNLVDKFHKQRVAATPIESTLESWHDSADAVANYLINSDTSGGAYIPGESGLFTNYISDLMVSHPDEPDTIYLANILETCSIPPQYTSDLEFLYAVYNDANAYNALPSFAHNFVAFTDEYVKTSYASIADIPLTINATLIRAGDNVIYKKNLDKTAWIEFASTRSNAEPTETDHSFSAVSSGNLTQGELCVLKDFAGVPKFVAADATTADGCSGLLGIALTDVADGSSGNFLLFGKFTTSGLSVGAIYYAAQTAGGITVTKTSTAGQIVRIIGYAESATVLFFNPSSTYIEVA